MPKIKNKVKRKIDKIETALPSNIESIREFLATPDRCCSKNCVSHFYETQYEALYQFGKDLEKCSQEAQEVALLTNLREHLHNPKSVLRGGERRRQRVAYSVFPFGPMCRQAYLLIWDIGVSKFGNCLTHMNTQGNTFRSRIHGRSGSVSPTALSTDLRKEVIQFILDLTEHIGEASEGRQGRRNLHTVKDKVVYFLPASYSIRRLYQQFLEKDQSEHSQSSSPPPLSLSSFRSIFYSDPCQHIRIRSPRSDVCDQCSLYRAYYRKQPEGSSLEISKTDEEKVKKWQEHLQLAKEAREIYNRDIKRAQVTLHHLRKKNPKLETYVAHYTFDFMQNLAIPNFADITKDMYFFSLRNIYVFSIRDDGEGKQFNYLYDEGDGGKGANYVISMLFYFLRQRQQHSATMIVHLHADNCSGQNKNNMVMQFFLLLAYLGFLKHTELKFMIRGHTHCTIDGGHGIIKKEWRKRTVFCIEQAAQVIQESSPIAGTQHAVILKPECFFDWERLLTKFFKKLPNLLSFQEFEMDATRPGIIRYRKHQRQSWKETSLFKKTPKFSSLQKLQETLIQLKRPGISEQKQKHLYEKVRKYLPEEFQDIVCPKPINYENI